MADIPLHFMPPGRLIALVGNPNCGKTALFNRLTGSQQKVANYAGVTVERKDGIYRSAEHQCARLLDLPGTYSLYPSSEDERVTCDVLSGAAPGERCPDVIICVVDATNLRRGLRLVLALQRRGFACVVALNMHDRAQALGIDIDTDALSEQLGVPVIKTVAVRRQGVQALRQWLDASLRHRPAFRPIPASPPSHPTGPEHDEQRIQQILTHLGIEALIPDTRSARIDRIVLHPVAGPILLVALLFMMFQAMFDWANLPMEWIKYGIKTLAMGIDQVFTLSPWPLDPLKSFLLDGVLAGVGSVLVFLPQILILFFFILVLEASGYLPRAAYLLDRLMRCVGLSGRSFIPLLSSFACAIPGISATRCIQDRRDRNLTILLSPLMTCSARLPVYALLISAFIPERSLTLGLSLQGLVMWGLYLLAIVSAMFVAWILKTCSRQGRQPQPLLLELPSYRMPSPLNIALGLWQRASIFIRRVGGMILLMSVLLWVLSNFPSPPDGTLDNPIQYSFAGMLGQTLAVVLAGIGFNWQIAIALVLGLSAREVAISALATVYALSDSHLASAQSLIPLIHQQWGMATGMALLAWFVFAPQCLPTFAAMRRETGSWKLPCLAFCYMLLLAYGAAWLAYHGTMAVLGLN